MAAPVREMVIVDVDTVDQVFNAPDANPFSSSESVVLGVAALERVMTQLQVRPLRDLNGAQLVVRLPEEQLEPDLEARLAAAIHRYCDSRIESNHLHVRLARKQRMYGLIVAFSVALLVLVTATLLLLTVLTDASTFVQTVVGGVAALFSWVIVWGPLEALLFDWAAPARENRALAHMMEMQVVVEKRS